MTLRAFPVSDWGFFRFAGADAKDFLQGLVTADMKKLAPGVCLPACVLTPKGLLVADCELYEEAPGIVLAVTRPAAAVGFLNAFSKKIMLSSSELKPLRSQTAWLVLGEGFSEGLPWNRMGEPGRLLLGVDPPTEAELLSPEAFHARRVAAGFPWFGLDLDGDTLPLEGRQEDAISLDKGCYMGQETVSRVVYRGHVNRVLMALGARAPLAEGASVLRGGKDVGRVTSAAGPAGLAMIRYADALAGETVEAGGVPAVLAIPAAWPKPLSKAAA